MNAIVHTALSLGLLLVLLAALSACDLGKDGGGGSGSSSADTTPGGSCNWGQAQWDQFKWC